MYSVLMSIYHKDTQGNLKLALESLKAQTLPPGEIVIVADGPLGQELWDTVDDFARICPCVKLYKLDTNQGLGKALSLGLSKCSFDLIGRMDSDDISLEHRFAKQVKLFEENPHISIASSWIAEFEFSQNNIVSIRRLPEYHSEILAYSKKRCPINHPSVMFRKSAVEKAGGYLHFPLFEDYYLWFRMLQDGAIFHNIQENLLLYRTSVAMFKRRGGFVYGLNEMKLFNMMYRKNFISPVEWILYVPARFITRLMPNILRSFVYRKLLRR